MEGAMTPQDKTMWSEGLLGSQNAPELDDNHKSLTGLFRKMGKSNRAVCIHCIPSGTLSYSEYWRDISASAVIPSI